MEQKHRYYKYFLEACSILNLRRTTILASKIIQLDNRGILQIGQCKLKLFDIQELPYGRLYVIGIYNDNKLIFKSSVILRKQGKSIQEDNLKTDRIVVALLLSVYSYWVEPNLAIVHFLRSDTSIFKDFPMIIFLCTSSRKKKKVAFGLFNFGIVQAMTISLVQIESY